MEPFTNIRMIVPSTLFFGSLLYVAWFGGHICYADLENIEAGTFAAIGGVVAGLLIPVGFFIDGIRVLLLVKLLWGSLANDPYEAKLSEAGWKRVTDSLGLSPMSKRSAKTERGWAALTFCRLKLDEKINRVLEQRFQVANTYANCIVALILSWLIAWFLLDMYPPCNWFVVAGTTTFISILMFWRVWLDLMSILEFSTLDIDDRKPPRRREPVSSAAP